MVAAPAVVEAGDEERRPEAVALQERRDCFEMGEVRVVEGCADFRRQLAAHQGAQKISPQHLVEAAPGLVVIVGIQILVHSIKRDLSSIILLSHLNSWYAISLLIFLKKPTKSMVAIRQTFVLLWISN